MKTPNLRLLSRATFLSISTSFLLIGCGKSFNSDAESARGTVKIQVIAPGSVATESAESLPYSFATVELFNIFDLVSVSGKFAQFFTKASRTENQVIGTQPRGQFLKGKDGIYVPRNFLSLQLATLYYHTQNLFKLETSLKLDSPRSTPLKIVLDTPIVNARQAENNAFYESSLDAIIFLKYSENDLPLSLNGGVFAHEYFHSIFERIVLKPLKSNTLFSIPITINKIVEHKTLEDVKNMDLSSQVDRLNKKLVVGPINLSEDNVKWYYALLLKGFNEGLADFWGWSYVNDISFIGHSLPQTKTTRKLDFKTQQINKLQFLSNADMLSIVYTASEKFETQSEKLELINAFSYLLGSRVALFFKAYSETIQTERQLSKENTKLIMNQLVVDFAKSLSESLTNATLASEDTQLVNAYSLLYNFAAKQSLSNENECVFLKTFLENDPKLSSTLDCLSEEQNFKLGRKGAP